MENKLNKNLNLFPKSYIYQAESNFSGLIKKMLEVKM